MEHFMEIQLCRSFNPFKSFLLNVFIFSFICNKNSGWQLLLFSFLEMLARVLGWVFLQMRRPQTV